MQTNLLHIGYITEKLPQAVSAIIRDKNKTVSRQKSLSEKRCKMYHVMEQQWIYSCFSCIK